MKQVAVVIPLYRNELSHWEQLSLARCKEVLGTKHDIIVVAPEGIDSHGLHAEHFDKKYFDGLKGYNKLMLSHEFYNRFNQYQYILIYQLDGWVFRDNLESWCNQGWEYIGAPWMIKGFKSHTLNCIARDILLKLKCYHTDMFRYRMVGNGGISIRHVRTFIEKSRNINNIPLNGTLNEDVYWSLVAGLKIPNWEVAIKFSIDEIPYPADNEYKPDFCHGFSKSEQNLEYWKKLINSK